MNAITVNETGMSPVLRDDLPTPTPGPREVLVRVQASSVNPVDNSIAAGMLAQMGVEYEYPVTLGRDYAGVVEQVGADVTDYAGGDEVFGFLLHANPTARDGSWSELITVSTDASIARRRSNVDVAAAGAAPLAAITAVTAVDALDLSASRNCSTPTYSRSPSRPPTSSTAPPRRCRRSGPHTPRASSPSASLRGPGTRPASPPARHSTARSIRVAPRRGE